MTVQLDTEQTKKQIQLLVEKLEEVIKGEKLSEFTEADVGSKFILPFLEALGWNTREIDEVREQRRTLTGPVDYSLNINKRPKIVLELKKLVEDLDGHRIIRGRVESYPEQAIRYAWHLKVDWVILTNFREIRLYYSHVIKPLDGLIFKIKYSEYITSLDRLLILSKESVLSGILDTYEKRRIRKDIDEAVLEDLFECRKVLVDSITRNNEFLTKEQVKECVQKILDRIIVIRVAEDRGIIGADSIWKELDSWKTRGLPTPFMRSLKSLFRDFDEIYNSKIFAKHLCEELKLDNEALEKVVNALYKYNFDLISADVLGAIYEDYIGYILKEEEKGISIVESLETRRKTGIYYTPIPIVDYIVKSALAEELKGKNPEEVSKIRILDPACGSGSFLIKAYDALKEYYSEYNKRVAKNAASMKNLIPYGSLIPNVEQKIVKENLYGVDLDPQATEIAAVNVMLKALRRGEKLPLILDENIKCGNSLVEDSAYSDRPFKWEEEFSEIIENSGFDVVIGNPPWGADVSKYSTYLESRFDLAKGQYDSYELFIELSKSILKKQGVWGFVVPDSIFKPEHTPLRKFLCTQNQLEKIVKLGEGFFENVFRASVVLIFRKKPPIEDHKVLCLTLMKENRSRLKTNSEIDLFAFERENAIFIPQKRFINNPDYAFDITSSEIDKRIMELMEKRAINWYEIFDTWRGVEFSEEGLVVQCPNCFKWDNPPRKRKGVYREKKCKHCGHGYDIAKALNKQIMVSDTKKNENDQPFITGEAVNRYYISSIKFLDVTKDGINYKEPSIYEGPKLLVRKTGVGIYATIDISDSYVPQAVFIFKLRKNLPAHAQQFKLEYFLGVMNSRLMLYYYYKKFGELEWKSFPYMTQKTIQQLPIYLIDFANPEQKKLHDDIVNKVSAVLKTKNKISEKLDFEIEDLVMKLYEIDTSYKEHIWDELRKVQRLRIIREVL